MPMKSIGILLAFLVAGGDVLAQSGTHDQPTAAEHCSAHAQIDGKEAVVALPSLKVTELTTADGPFVMPADAPASVSAIQCWRESLIPTRNDYKVLKAGFTLFITAPENRTLALLLSDGQLTVSYDKDEMSSEEIQQIRRYVDATKGKFQKRAGRR